VASEAHEQPCARERGGGGAQQGAARAPGVTVPSRQPRDSFMTDSFMTDSFMTDSFMI